MIRVVSRPPRIAQILGYAGLLPMLGCLLLVAMGPPALKAMALTGALLYAALIFSFIGGAWWGLAARDDIHPNFPTVLLVSVVPSLVAWVCAFVGGSVALLVLAALFAAALLFDRRLADGGFAPEWWLALRQPLALGMAAGNAAIALLALLRQAG